jgi:fumarylacetoacetase
MTPLGPLNGKNFATSISPWVVTLDALESCREQGTTPQNQDVASYLRDDGKGHYDISLKVEIITAADDSTVVCQSQMKNSLHWNIRQLLAHQSVGGCGLASGDMLATGTVSGTGEDTRGCLLESTRGGRQPLSLENGVSRRYLEDGDCVRFTAIAGDASAGVGFGECLGRVSAAAPQS